jgi:hypothetical protein
MNLQIGHFLELRMSHGSRGKRFILGISVTDPQTLNVRSFYSGYSKLAGGVSAIADRGTARVQGRVRIARITIFNGLERSGMRSLCIPCRAVLYGSLYFVGNRLERVYAVQWNSIGSLCWISIEVCTAWHMDGGEVKGSAGFMRGVSK